MQWERFDENFDILDGGALFVRDGEQNSGWDYEVAGVLWLDTIGNDVSPYYAFIAGFDAGNTYDGIEISDRYTAVDAFNGTTDEHVIDEIGWFDTLAAAAKATEEYVSGERC